MALALAECFTTHVVDVYLFLFSSAGVGEGPGVREGSFFLAFLPMLDYLSRRLSMLFGHCSVALMAFHTCHVLCFSGEGS